MRTRISAALGLLLTVAVGMAEAQTPESTTQMQLVGSSVFLNRMTYLAPIVAKEVLEEVADGSGASPITYTVACHALRVDFAKRVAATPPAYSPSIAVWVSGTNESGAVIVGTVTGSGSTADSSATDTALKQAMRWKWNAMALCVTNP